MTLICLASQKGSPGTTMTSLAVAAALQVTEGRQKVMVEADCTGGTLAIRYQLPVEPGLLTLAAAVRGGVDADSLWRHTQELPGGLRVVVCPDGPDQVHAAMSASGAALGRFLNGLGNVDVICDVGRLAPDSPALAFVSEASALLMVARPTAEQLQPAARRMLSLRPHIENLGWVLVGERPYGPAEVESTYKFPVVGVMADDARAVARLEQGLMTKRIRRSPFVRSSTTLASTLAGWLAPLQTIEEPIGAGVGIGAPAAGAAGGAIPPPRGIAPRRRPAPVGGPVGEDPDPSLDPEGLEGEPMVASAEVPLTGVPMPSAPVPEPPNPHRRIDRSPGAVPPPPLDPSLVPAPTAAVAPTLVGPDGPAEPTLEPAIEPTGGPGPDPTDGTARESTGGLDPEFTDGLGPEPTERPVPESTGGLGPEPTGRPAPEPTGGRMPESTDGRILGPAPEQWPAPDHPPVVSDPAPPGSTVGGTPPPGSPEGRRPLPPPPAPTHRWPIESDPGDAIDLSAFPPPAIGEQPLDPGPPDPGPSLDAGPPDPGSSLDPGPPDPGSSLDPGPSDPGALDPVALDPGPSPDLGPSDPGALDRGRLDPGSSLDPAPPEVLVDGAGSSAADAAPGGRSEWPYGSPTEPEEPPVRPADRPPPADGESWDTEIFTKTIDFEELLAPTDTAVDLPTMGGGSDPAPAGVDCPESASTVDAAANGAVPAAPGPTDENGSSGSERNSGASGAVEASAERNGSSGSERNSGASGAVEASAERNGSSGPENRGEATDGADTAPGGDGSSNRRLTPPSPFPHEDVNFDGWGRR